MGHRITKFRIPLAGPQPLTSRPLTAERESRPCSKAANDDGPKRDPSVTTRTLSVETWDINGAF